MTRSTVTLIAAAALALAACERAPAGTESAGAALSAAPALTGSALDPNAPEVYRFRSEEDPAFPPEAAVCAAAGFQTNVPLGASLYAEAVRSSDGRIMNAGTRRIGRATACARITDPTFPAGLPQQFYAKFDLPIGAVTAVGACTLVSNDVPQRGLVLAGCHLRVIDAPAGYAGGSVTSLSVFNPARLAGFSTGSEWTVQLYPSAGEP